jgi:broad specificity phosphatase PhoE
VSNLPTIYFVRHGQTDWNEQGLIQGTVETDLNATGVRQARVVADALAQKEPLLRSFDFYVSPQLRAQHTMHIICAAQPRDFATVKIEPRLRELGFGIWEGKPFNELRNQADYPHAQASHYEWRPESGESYADGVTRVDGFLRELKNPTLIVAHGAIGRCLIGYVCRIPRIDITHLATPQGCYCVLQDGKYQWFDESHQPQ